jgi:hypothetical protein
MGTDRLMRFRDENGQDWAEIINFLTRWPDARRLKARLLGEARRPAAQGAVARGD